MRGLNMKCHECGRLMSFKSKTTLWCSNCVALHELKEHKEKQPVER